ncbi:MAG: clan AA aspartic protease [Planctomycetes bacterium]|nr:clan AA aspartic protease [Planctomycetota bacterium]
MGITPVTATLRNPASRLRAWEGLFLVDTGSVDCLVPGKHLRKIRLKLLGKRGFELADGTEVMLDIPVAEVELMGERVGAAVTFGKDDTEPTLGVSALESMGIETDPRNQRWKRLFAVRLKAAKLLGALGVKLGKAF